MAYARREERPVLWRQTRRESRQPFSRLREKVARSGVERRRSPTGLWRRMRVVVTAPTLAPTLAREAGEGPATAARSPRGPLRPGRRGATPPPRRPPRAGGSTGPRRDRLARAAPHACRVRR